MAEHKFYVGLTDMVLNRTGTQLQISHRYFLDDMELALAKHSGTPVKIERDMDSLVLPVLESYLRGRFELEHGEEKLDWTFLGYEIDNDLLWCYMECPFQGAGQPLTVANPVLMEIYPGQTNLVHLDIDGDVSSLFLNAEEYRGRLE
jgi:hypothetical protein